MPTKQDSTAGEIVSGLRAAGVFVRFVEFQHSIAGCPDILWAYQGRMGLMELKAKRGRLSPAQQKFLAEWPGPPVPVVRTVEEALAVVEYVSR